MADYTNLFSEFNGKITQLYASLIETLEVMSDSELMASIRQGLEEMKENKGIPWEEAKKDLRL